MANLPNILTIIRFIMVPIFIALMIAEQTTAAVIIYVTACLTDFADGYIARRFRHVTAFGKFMDPFADKLLQVSALVLLTVQHKIYLWITLVIFIKEVFIGIGGLLLFKKYKIYSGANLFGKISTVLLYLSIVATLIYGQNIYTTSAVLLALALSILAFVVYTVRFRKDIEEYKQTSGGEGADCSDGDSRG